jgi:high-affinity iron transporter
VRRDLEAGLEGFRAAPLAPVEEVRRAGQILRFLALVPIEYDRGVEDGRVTLDFEVQGGAPVLAGRGTR